MEAGPSALFTCCTSIAACLLLSVGYVASLYVWSSKESRDHPSVILRRFFSVFVMMCLSPPIVYLCMNDIYLRKTSMLHLLGMKVEGLFLALVLPLGLTMVLFLGPLLMICLSGLWRQYTVPIYWITTVQDLVFWRSIVVAPVAEEFVFRACMMPLLLQYFQPMTAVFVAPLFFGVAHLHHIVDRIKHEGLPFNHALIVSCFQMFYSTVFGAYSAFLFVRTGHLAAPCIAHAFCNHMGLPDFSEINAYKNPQKFIISVSFVLGLILWCFLLVPVTTPSIYSNNLFWKQQL